MGRQSGIGEVGASAVDALKKQSGADDVVAQGLADYGNWGPPQGSAPATNQAKYMEMLRQQQQCGGQQPQPTPGDGTVPAPAPAPQPGQGGDCPTACPGVALPPGYQILNQPLQPGQVYLSPGNFAKQAQATDRITEADTQNYETTKQQDGLGKVLQNFRFAQETSDRHDQVQSEIKQSESRTKAENFAIRLDATGRFVGTAANGASGILGQVAYGWGNGKMVWGPGMGMWNRGGYGYGGGFGGGYPILSAGMCNGAYYPGGGSGWGYGNMNGRFGGGPIFGGPIIPNGGFSQTFIGGQTYAPIQPGFQPTDRPSVHPLPMTTDPYRDCNQICPPEKRQFLYGNR